MKALSSRAAVVRLSIFAVVSFVVTGTIAATIRPFGDGGGTKEYTALFATASRLEPGDDVRVAGVQSGKVRAVDVTPDARARITFDLADDVPIGTRSRLEVRYLDLAGNRYLAVVSGGERDRIPQPTSRVINAARTRPALDLDDLLDGFKPLLIALEPQQVNGLALDIIRTLQGDGGTVQSLIARTASLTTGLAQRDALIGDVVTNLDTVVGTVADRHDELEELIRELRKLVGGLADDRKTIGTALGHIDTMTTLATDLLADVRPSTKADIASLAEVAGTLASPTGKAELDHALSHLPDKLARLSATASYGSWFNYYVCGVRVTTGTGSAVDPVVQKILSKIHLVDTSARCDPKEGDQ